MTKRTKKQQAGPFDDEEEDVYFVEKIVGKRFNNHMPEYQVKWKGWGKQHNTWEPVRHLYNVPEEIDKYEEQQEQKLVGRKRKAPPPVKRSTRNIKKKKVIELETEEEDDSADSDYKVEEDEAVGDSHSQETGGDYTEESKEESESEEESEDEKEVVCRKRGGKKQSLEELMSELSLEEGKKMKGGYCAKEVYKITRAKNKKQMKCYLQLKNGGVMQKDLEEVRMEYPQLLIDYLIKQARPQT